MRHTYSYSEQYQAYIRDCLDFYIFAAGAGRFNMWRSGHGGLFNIPQVTVPDTVLILQGIEL